MKPVEIDYFQVNKVFFFYKQRKINALFVKKLITFK